MKLTRNKIRKIRKQRHQSVKKWKKTRNSIRRKVVTFRRSPLDLIPKRKNVFNKTLKKYIPIQVLEYLKEKYLNMRRMRRKQRRMNMMSGGALETTAPAAASAPAAPPTPATDADTPAPAAEVNNDSDAAPPADAPDAPPAVTAADTPAPPAPPADVKNDGDAAPAAADAVATATDADPAAAAGPDASAAVNEVKPLAVSSPETTPTVPKTDAAAPAAAAQVSDNSAKTPDNKKKSAGFSLGPDIPGDISIHSETHELKKLGETWHLVEFLIKKGLPYYIQLELNGQVLKKHDSDIFDLRRILYGKYVTKENFDKAGDKQELYFKTGSEVGIADGDSISSDNNTDVFIFTGEKVLFDPTSKENSIKLITAPQTSNEKSFVVTDSKRLYKLNGVSPFSIDNTQEIGILGGNSIDISEFRLQVAPLSDTDFKNAVATASSDDGDKKKRKKIVTDDTNSYVVNLSLGCKVTSIQTLRKSLEMVRISLEDKDDAGKKEAMDTIKLINGLLQNPEFAKNEGFDDFKEKVFSFTYKIPGTERKYGIAQLMTFFEQEKDNLPKDLIKGFFKMITLLGHGPAGENGACLAFDRPQSIEVIEYTKTLENGDIVTTKKLGSKMNMEGFGSELEKLNATNAPKEEDEKNAEGADAKKAEGADAKNAEGADAKKAEGADAKNAEGADAKKAPAPAKSVASQNQAATAIAIAAVSSAQANVDKPTAGDILLKDIPKEPIPPSEEVKAINELYKDDKTRRKSKIDKILNLKKNFNPKLNRLVTLLGNILKGSILTPSNKKNTYLNEPAYKGEIAELEGLVDKIKDDPDYKIIKDFPDEITSELKISKFRKEDNEKKLLAKIDKLFYIYWNIWKSFNSVYDYFKKYKNMTESTFAFNDSALEIRARFREEITNMENYIKELAKDASETTILEQQLTV